MPDTIDQYSAKFIEFSKKRGWWDEDPNELIVAVLQELAELSEHYAWQKDFSKIKNISEDEKTALAYEFVDVINYLIRLAAESDLELGKYFEQKLPLLEEKFKVGQSARKSHLEYRKTGKNKLYK